MPCSSRNRSLPGRDSGNVSSLRDATLPLLVVVTGPPAAGKTRIARVVAEELRLPLIAKDDIKETLFETLGTGDREWSRRLGRATFEVQFRLLRELLAAGCSVIAEGNFNRTDAFSALPRAHVFQIVCTAERDELLRRFRERTAGRHPGHVDHITIEELGPRLFAHEWRPLALGGELVELNTSAPPAEVTARLRRALRRYT